MFEIFVFEDAHHLVEEWVVELEGIHLVNGFFDNGAVVESLSRRGFIGVDEAWHAEQLSAEVTCHDDANVGDVFREDLVEDRFAGSARRLAVVARAVASLVGTDHEGVAVMFRVEIALANLGDTLFHLRLRMHRKRLCDELGALLFVEPLAFRRYNLI